jgi:hypothetical protein
VHWKETITSNGIIFIETKGIEVSLHNKKIGTYIRLIVLSLLNVVDIILNAFLYTTVWCMDKVHINISTTNVTNQRSIEAVQL